MKKNLSLYLVLFALLLCSCGQPSVGDASSGRSRQEEGPTWQEQYDLGLRYLSEGNYEEAIIAFTAAIEIDDTRPEAYQGRGQSYYKLVPLVEAGNTFDLLENFDMISKVTRYCYEQSIQNYDRAIELAPDVVEYYDDVIKIALECGRLELVLRYCEMKYQNTDDTGFEDLYQTIQKGYALTDRLEEAFRAGDDGQIFALMQGEDYHALITIQEYLKAPFLRPYGEKTLGVYRVDDEKYGHCMIYYGDCEDGVRSGSGAWYGYYNGNNYASHGDWSEDKPNGYFETKEWNSELNESVVYRLISGDVSNGLWNGSVLWAFDQTEGYHSWNCTFVDGIGQFVRENLWSEESNEGGYGSLSPAEGSENKARGIAGFVQS